MGSKRMLIIEDEEIARTLYKRLLDRMECRYDMASTVKEARGRIAAAEGYDLLVTDMRLPDGRGTDVLKDFHGRFPAAKVLIVTGSPELTPAGAVPEIEMVKAEWLFKPFELEDFLEAVTRLLSKSS